MSRGNKLGATYMFLIEHVVLGNNVLNFIDSVIGLGFRKGALVAEQGDVDRSCTPKLLMENLQVIAKKKNFIIYFQEEHDNLMEHRWPLFNKSFAKAVILTYYFPPSRAINLDLCDASEKILWV